jgi:tripeptide aminopeptidase
VKFVSKSDYLPFRIKEDSPVVQRAAAAVRAIGREPNLRVTNGGLDANWMVKHGIPTVTFGAGQNEIHTVKEYVDLAEFESGCRLALALATS